MSDEKVPGPVTPARRGVPTPAPGSAKLLLIAVTRHLDEHYPHWRYTAGALPAGLQVQMHPSVYHGIRLDPANLDWPSRSPEGLAREFGLPVKVTMDLPEGTWRLVVVTEDVKLGGKL